MKLSVVHCAGNANMAGILPTIATILTLLILLPILPILKHRLALYLSSRRHPNTASPPRIPSIDPIFGLDTILSDLQSRKEKNKVKTTYAQFALYSKTFAAYPFGRRTITTCDPRNVQFILSTEAEKFGNAPVREATVSMLGRGIINSDGEEWRRSRGLVMPTFTRARIAEREGFERHVRRFLEGLRRREDGREVVVDLKLFFDSLVSLYLSDLICLG